MYPSFVVFNPSFVVFNLSIEISRTIKAVTITPKAEIETQKMAVFKVNRGDSAEAFLLGAYTSTFGGAFDSQQKADKERDVLDDWKAFDERNRMHSTIGKE